MAGLKTRKPDSLLRFKGKKNFVIFVALFVSVAAVSCVKTVYLPKPAGEYYKDLLEAEEDLKSCEEQLNESIVIMSRED